MNSVYVTVISIAIDTKIGAGSYAFCTRRRNTIVTDDKNDVNTIIDGVSSISRTVCLRKISRALGAPGNYRVSVLPVVRPTISIVSL